MDADGYILLVEDEQSIQDNNKKILERHGYRVIQAYSLAQARGAIAQVVPLAVILDIMLPDGNGLDFMREYLDTLRIPTLILSALHSPQDMVGGLRAGGDGYLAKPYSLAVFLSNVEALLRRASTVPAFVRVGSINIDVCAGRAFIDGKDMSLPPKEFSLLLLLAQNVGKVLDTDYLYERLSGRTRDSGKGALKNAVSKLKVALEDSEYTISSEWGKGYALEKR